MQTKELFEQITQFKGWGDRMGYSANYQALIVARHEAHALAFNMYTKIFTAYGYKKDPIVWKRD